MQKKKTSLKKRIFALVGVTFVLMSVFVVTTSAYVGGDDLTLRGSYYKHSVIPTTPSYNYEPSWVNNTLFQPYVTYVFYEDGDEKLDYMQTPIFTRDWDWHDGRSVQEDVSISNGLIVSDRLTTTRDVGLKLYPFVSYIDDFYLDPLFVLEYIEVSGGGFWLYPMQFEGGRDFDDIIQLMLWGISDFTASDVTISCDWRFLNNSIVYNSCWEDEISGFDGEWLSICYIDLIDYCTNDYVSVEYPADISSPIFIDNISIKVTPKITGSLNSYSLFIQVPCMKEEELSLYTTSMNETFDIGDLTLNVTNPEFDLSMLYNAVEGFLSTAFIGDITFGGLLIGFLCLSVVLAVYAMFRGST